MKEYREYQEEDIRPAGEDPEGERRKKWRNRLIWVGCAAVPVVEIWIVGWLGLHIFATEAITWMLLGALLIGAWAWMFARERLPDDYDKNRLTFRVGDIIRVRIPGLAFNNRNWPHVLWAVRIWSAATMVLPMTLLLPVRAFWWIQADAFRLFPKTFPAALILAVIFTAKWYELEEKPAQDAEEIKKSAPVKVSAPISDYQVDKVRLGAFIAEGRKRLGLTQKEFAGRLYISDKAVSKWERGLSIPDVGLLIPLADLLGVTVTELLEGRYIESDPGMGMDEVEQVVKRALSFTGEATTVNRVTKRHRRLIWIGCTMAALLELWLVFFYTTSVTETTWVLVMLGVIFGGWAWMGAKERLPDYYDQNRISFYSDGIFKLHTGGLAFNNRNWPYILRTIRIWSIAATLLPQVLSFVGRVLFRSAWSTWELFIFLLLFLGGLFVPVYIVGWRYEKGDPRQ